MHTVEWNDLNYTACGSDTHVHTCITSTQIKTECFLQLCTCIFHFHKWHCLTNIIVFRTSFHNTTVSRLMYASVYIFASNYFGASSLCICTFYLTFPSEGRPDLPQYIEIPSLTKSCQIASQNGSTNLHVQIHFSRVKCTFLVNVHSV